MNKNSKIELLNIARNVLESTVNNVPVAEVDSDNPEIQGEQGVFVTLKNRGKLRGCLGRFVSDIPLYKLVAIMAKSSATEDSRFALDPIRSEELNDINIEISALSPLSIIENPLDIELGKHGIYIKKGFFTGCFLPQVATETGWSKEEFLSNCCSSKAGMSANAWKDEDTDVFIFTAEIFNEAEMEKEQG